jgi:ABC-type lipoprotein release transport system permease subunit
VVNPWTFGGVSFLLILAGLMACYLPASRAAGTDPVRALKAE